jgi:hypothetical protein
LLLLLLLLLLFFPLVSLHGGPLLPSKLTCCTSSNAEALLLLPLPSSHLPKGCAENTDRPL